jgi:hypothetical protein
MNYRNVSNYNLKFYRTSSGELNKREGNSKTLDGVLEGGPREAGPHTCHGFLILATGELRNFHAQIF